MESLWLPAIAVVVAIGYYYVHNHGNQELPPGPKGLPLLGNVWDAPGDHPWLGYTKLAQTYGEIVYMSMFGESMVILNSVKAVTELFERRSSNYSDRPPMHMANCLMGYSWDLAHMRYGDHWRRHRRTFHQYFHPNAAKNYFPIQAKATAALLGKLLDTPDRFIAHLRCHAGSIILKVVYGYDIKPENDSYVALADEAMKGLTQAVNAGSFLVDFLPILEYVPAWFPGARFKRQAREWRQSGLALRDKPFAWLKKSMAEGTAGPSFAAENLENMKNFDLYEPIQEEVIKNCSGIAYLAGSDTTVSAVTSFVLAMALYPEVQKRAQAELDAVVGHGRLPHFSDRPSLPYVEAIVSETLRWNPVTPLALPHRNLREDVYEGYYIPAGSTVVGNAWAILHDPVAYPDPMTFVPERFLKRDGVQPPPDPASFAFGFGRRICPGRYLAINSVWIAIASILSTFNISKAKDENGVDIEPTIEYHSGTVTHPMPFGCSINPRSEMTKGLIQTLAEEGI